jgi:hypothetical protein
VGSTELLIKSGFDAQVFDNFRQTTNDAAWPGAVIGSGAAALVSGVWLYYSSKSSGNKETLGASFVIAQASLITVSYVIFLKAFTGRAHPSNRSPLSSRDQSEDFKFGFTKPLTGYGWPSGHVSHTVAVTSALAYYYPTKRWLKWLSAGLSSYMLYTVSAFDSGQMHWFSDGVAGAFMGYAIGSSVGKNFRQQIDQSAPQTSALQFLPVIGSNYVAMMGSFEF